MPIDSWVSTINSPGFPSGYIFSYLWVRSQAQQAAAGTSQQSQGGRAASGRPSRWQPQQGSLAANSIPPPVGSSADKYQEHLENYYRYEYLRQQSMQVQQQMTGLQGAVGNGTVPTVANGVRPLGMVRESFFSI